MVELIVIRVITIVLAMLFLIPLFDPVYWRPEPLLFDTGGLALLHYTYQAEGNSSLFNKLATSYENNVQAGSGPVYWLVINGTVLRDGSNYKPLRPAEFEFAAVGNSFVHVDVRAGAIFGAWLNLLEVVFVLGILAFGSLVFSWDAQAYIIAPIERLVGLMQAMADDPLRAKALVASYEAVKGQEQFETTALFMLFGKLTSLLQLSFGEASSLSRAREFAPPRSLPCLPAAHPCPCLLPSPPQAGAAIIAENMRKSGGTLQAMVPGRRVTAIFGFCDVRSFTETTELLQEEICEFINAIAEILHAEVALHGGSANKNIGDAFVSGSPLLLCFYRGS